MHGWVMWGWWKKHSHIRLIPRSSHVDSLVYLFHLFIGYSALAGLTACLFYFWVEAPFGELERLLFQRRPAPAIKGVVVEEERIKEDPLAGVVVVVPVSVGTEPREESTEAAVPQ